MSDKDVQHEIRADVLRVAQEMGATPALAEYHRNGGQFSDRQIYKHFGGWVMLVTGLGLTPAPKNKPKALTNSIFEKNLETVLEEYEPRPAPEVSVKTPTLIIPDTHFPFASQRTLDKIYAWAEKHKPGHVIQIGDLYDLYAHSKFPRSQNVYMPEQEEQLGRKGAEVMWSTIKRIVPAAQCFQIKGNHDLRPLKQTLSNMPSLEHVIAKYLDELMTFPGVTLISDPRQEHLFEGVQYIHGYLSGTGRHLNSFVSTVHGHTHTGGTVFKPILNPLTGEIRVIWELDAGFAGDRESKVFGYTPQKTGKETNGFGWLDSDGPRFVLA